MLIEQLKKISGPDSVIGTVKTLSENALNVTTKSGVLTVPRPSFDVSTGDRLRITSGIVTGKIFAGRTKRFVV